MAGGADLPRSSQGRLKGLRTDARPADAVTGGQVDQAGIGEGEGQGHAVGETVVSEGGYELKYVLPADGNGPAKKAAGHFHADGKFHEGEH